MDGWSGPLSGDLWISGDGACQRFYGGSGASVLVPSGGGNRSEPPGGEGGRLF